MFYDLNLLFIRNILTSQVKKYLHGIIVSDAVQFPVNNRTNNDTEFFPPENNKKRKKGVEAKDFSRTIPNEEISIKDLLSR